MNEKKGDGPEHWRQSGEAQPPLQSAGSRDSWHMYIERPSAMANDGTHLCTLVARCIIVDLCMLNTLSAKLAESQVVATATC